MLYNLLKESKGTASSYNSKDQTQVLGKAVDKGNN
jgi:hypothetical protein